MAGDAWNAVWVRSESINSNSENDAATALAAATAHPASFTSDVFRARGAEGVDGADFEYVCIFISLVALMHIPTAFA